eukprot:jgi/Mesvir1/13606/Mv05135-RA.1
MPTNRRSTRVPSTRRPPGAAPRSDDMARSAWDVRGTTRPRSRHHAVMAAAFASATAPGLEYPGEDAPFCSHGVAKGLTMARALRLFRAVYPDFPEAELQEMTRDEMCEKMSYDAVDAMTKLVCAKLMDANTDPGRMAHLVAIAAALDDRPAEAYAGIPKRILCEMISERLKPHQRFRFLRKLVPTRAMKSISDFARKAAGAAGDAAQLGQIVLSAPGVDSVLGQAPLWLRGAMLGMGALRSMYQPNGVLKAGFTATAIPTLLQLAKTPVPSTLGQSLAGMPDGGGESTRPPGASPVTQNTSAAPRHAHDILFDDPAPSVDGPSFQDRLREMSSRALEWGMQKAGEAGDAARLYGPMAAEKATEWRDAAAGYGASAVDRVREAMAEYLASPPETDAQVAYGPELPTAVRPGRSDAVRYDAGYFGSGRR